MKFAAVLLILAGTTWAQVAAESDATLLSRNATPTSTSPAISPVPATATPQVNVVGTTSLPVGTAVYARLETRLSTSHSVVGDKFSSHVIKPVMVGERTMIPVGATIEGTVTKVSEPRRIKGRPTLKLRPEQVVMPNGERWTLAAVLVDTNLYPFIDVDEEGAVKGKGRDNDDWRETGVGVGGGALLGAVVGGGPGLLIGGAVGGTATVVHWLSDRRTAELPAGTELIMELSRPLILGTTTAGL